MKFSKHRNRSSMFVTVIKNHFFLKVHIMNCPH